MQMNFAKKPICISTRIVLVETCGSLAAHEPGAITCLCSSILVETNFSLRESEVQVKLTCYMAQEFPTKKQSFSGPREYQ